MQGASTDFDSHVEAVALMGWDMSSAGWPRTVDSKSLGPSV